MFIKENSLIMDKTLGLGRISNISVLQNSVTVCFKNKRTCFPLYLFKHDNLNMFRTLGLELIRK